MAVLTRLRKVLRSLVVPALACAQVGAGAAAAPGTLSAQLFLTQEEALEEAFGSGAVLERKTAFLTPQELARVGELAGAEHDAKQEMVTYYVAHRGGSPVGVAYFDVHRVRTLPEVLMIAVDPEGRVARIEVLKFSEPPDYLAPEGWLDQFDERKLDDRLSLKGDIVNMTGATLTSRAVTSAVRRALALQEVLDPFERRPASRNPRP